MSAAKLQSSCRIRSTPYKRMVEAHGVSGFSVVNHTLLPKGFGKTPQEDYWHLREHVQIWDVGCQRQVELKGKDAAYLAQLMTPRDLTKSKAGDCLYAPMVDENGGMLNDPIILKLAEDKFWFSIADSDVLLWAKGLKVGFNLDVKIDEPDVWPMAVQGPKSDALMAKVFGSKINALSFFKFGYFEFQGHPLLIARSGYSKQGGFEIYLDKSALAEPLWQTLWEAGLEFEIAPGCPNLIERIEGGLFSYGNEMTRQDNPLECGLEKYCRLDGSIKFIGLAALQEFTKKGIDRQLRGVVFDGGHCPPCSSAWQVSVDGETVGKVTSAIWSPRFEANVAIVMIDNKYWQPGQKVSIHSEDCLVRNGKVRTFPL